MSQAAETRMEKDNEARGHDQDKAGGSQEVPRRDAPRGQAEAQQAAPAPAPPEALDPVRLVEAALFTAGRPVGVDELALATALPEAVVKKAARSLEQEYEESGDQTALEVHMAGAKWAMQLKTVYVDHAKNLARMEIPKKTLKTLALIAFHQPMLQSELVDMIGSKTYEHVRELWEIGLVKSRPDGLSKRLTTSESFPEYFGIPATDTQEIRVYLAKKVGLSLSQLKGETDLDDFAEAAPASPAEVEAAAREIDAEKGEESVPAGEAGAADDPPSASGEPGPAEEEGKATQPDDTGSFADEEGA